MSLVPPVMRQRLVSKASASTHAVSVFPVPVDPVSATTSGSYRSDCRLRASHSSPPWSSSLLLLFGQQGAWKTRVKCRERGCLGLGHTVSVCDGVTYIPWLYSDSSCFFFFTKQREGKQAACARAGCAFVQCVRARCDHFLYVEMR